MTASHSNPATAWPRWRVFPPVALGVIMATLDASVVNIALPTLQRVLHAPLSTVTWIALAYSLTITGGLLAAGRFADARGRKRVYGMGLIGFTVASLLCGLAPNLPALVLARVLQGLGAAGILSVNTALIRFIYPARQLGRAIGNLLENAAKFSPADTPIEVHEVGGVVTVRDHGPGIDPADLPHVFERFYRADAARALPGSGLGLAIVAQIAADHGGSVRAENAPDGGVIVTIALPPAARESDESPGAEPNGDA